MGPAPFSVALPADCEMARGRRGVLVRRRDEKEALASVGFGPDGGERLDPSELAGRRPLEGFAWGGRRYAVRRFTHGGLLRALTGARFADPGRPFRELAHADLLTAAGIATPRVAAARAVRAWPFGWHLALVTHRVERAADLATVLATSSPRSALLSRVGELVGRLHRLGFLHADLHPRNLLVAEGTPGPEGARVWVLDLDRCSRRQPLPENRRLDNLCRLYRSVRRTAAQSGRPLGRADYRRFLAGYARGAERNPALWRSDWRAIVRREARRAPGHRLGWFLERWFGGRRSGPG
ncbi:MAG: lipopolysaccharide kinase InaA family protein [Planctomycetota bacterium]